MSDKYARLTFNDSAQRKYFGDSRGLRVRIEDGNILFRPTIDNGQIPIMSSSTGKMADIDAAEAQSKRMMQIIQNSGYSPKEPFFVLCEGDRGWLTIEHFPFDKAPPKNVPHFRVWPLRWSPSLDLQNSDFDMKTWRAARQMVLRACQTVQQYEKGPRVGRPPKAVQQAEEVMGSLHQLLAELARVNKAEKPTIVHRSHVAPDDDISTKVMDLMANLKLA